MYVVLIVAKIKACVFESLGLFKLGLILLPLGEN